MASPPRDPASSPSLALPRKRPTLALPSQSSRKPSLASSTTSTAHPLRQTSFPPQDTLEAQHAAAEIAALQQYSPSQGSLEDEFSDSEIVSAISGPTTTADGTPGGGSVTKKRKRGEKKPRGRPAKALSLSQSQLGGGAGAARTGSASLVNDEAPPRGNTAGADDEEDSDEDITGTGGAGGRQPLYAGGEMNAQEFAADQTAKSKFRHYMELLDNLPLTSTHPSRDGLTVKDMSERYDVFSRAKLRSNDIRRLVNQTLSQSVPHNVVTVVSSYAKMFAGMIVEGAREAQAEWEAMEEKRADGEANPAYKRLKRSHPIESADENAPPNPSSSPPTKFEQPTTPAATIKQESSSSPTQPDTQQLTQISPPPQENGTALPPGGASGLQSSLQQCDLSPLQPDHLREALRRYKKARAGGTVGFTGLSLEGREVAAARMGGRRLFR